jgi:hypothetical protein
MGICSFVDTIVASHEKQKRPPSDCGPWKSTCFQAAVALFSILVLVVARALPVDAQTAGIDASVVAGLASTANIVRWTGTLPKAAGQTVDVSFALYQESAGGLELWSETQQVKVGADGHYAVLLGVSSAEGLPRALFQAGEARWIEARPIIAQQIAYSGGYAIASSGRDTIADESNATPPSRSLLTAVPYAFKSIDAETLAGRAATDYVTREDLQSTVANQVQAISSMSTSLSVVGTSTQIVGTPLPLGGTSTSSASTITGKGTYGYLPTWIGSAILGNSIIAESGTSVGIGTNTPATMLDVNGDSTLRGVVSLLATAATLSTGVNSPALQLGASAYSSTSNAAVQQNFAWQAQSAGNNTASPSANLMLLFGSGTTEPTATGLSITPNGQITFVQGQVFPGTSLASSSSTGGSGTITGVIAGTGLTGGGSNGNVILALAGPVSTDNGGTGASTSSGALANLGGISSTLTTPQSIAGSLSLPTLTASANTEINVMAAPYNALCNGSHDDTSAIQAAFAALGSSGGSVLIPNAVCMVNSGVIDVAGSSGVQRNYRTLRGLGKKSQIICQPKSAQTACVRSVNGAHLTIENLYIYSNSNVTYNLELTTTGTAEGVTLDNLDLLGGQYALAIAPDTSLDLAHVHGTHIRISSAYTAGVVIGNGTQGNVLDNSLDDYNIDLNPIGVPGTFCTS